MKGRLAIRAAAAAFVGVALRRKGLAAAALVVALGVVLVATDAAAQHIVIETIPVPWQPTTVGVNSVTNRIYVTHGSYECEGPGVSVIDGATNSVSGTVALPAMQKSLGFVGVNESTNRIYVAHACWGESGVHVIDGATDTLVGGVAVAAGGDRGIAVNAATDRVYVGGMNAVGVVDGATNTVVATVPLGHEIRGVAVNPATNRVYVVGFDDVSIIDGNTNTVVDSVAVGFYPYGVAVNPSTNRIYVTDIDSADVWVIDGDANAVVETIPVGSMPTGVAVNPITNRIYVANTLTNNVSVIDGETNTVVETIAVGSMPFGVAVNATISRIYVANYSSDTVSVIEDTAGPVATVTPTPAVTSTHTPTPIVTSTDTPTPTPTGSLPDLVVTHMKIEFERGGACDWPGTELGVRVWIRNIGGADAGPFAVDVNGSQQMVPSGLAAGQEISLWFPGYVYSGENTATADATLQVEESNEDNNTLSELVPIPTPPATCTPTATATATPTPMPPPVRMEKDLDEDATEVLDAANLFLEMGPHGLECLTVYELVSNAGNAADGVGSYEFQLKYDHKVFDIGIEDASWLSNGGAREVDCSMSIFLENDIRWGCASSGPTPGQTADGTAAIITVCPEADLVSRLTPGQENGVVRTLLDENCQLADVYGDPLPGTLPGGLLEVCGDMTITVRILEADLNLDCEVDVSDVAAIAFRYGSSFGSMLYDPWYDLEPALKDSDIDIKDLQKVFGRQGSTCEEPIPDQPPE